ncbi:hypothetical protein PBY51_008161 [Eleginops maclovinus]|uniref:Uncharacterized protein n=1 Tax=Eleginops maclovinus TaxID=56733 RepID=A0AAN7X2V6_ELEMC|nr:hypothetical protein PBY51_008161 [Eleginops maclovinus]
MLTQYVVVLGGGGGRDNGAVALSVDDEKTLIRAISIGLTSLAAMTAGSANADHCTGKGGTDIINTLT